MNAMMALIIVIFLPSAQIQTEVSLVPVVKVSLGMVLLAQVLMRCDTAVRCRLSFETMKIMLSHRCRCDGITVFIFPNIVIEIRTSASATVTITAVPTSLVLQKLFQTK